MSQDEQLRKIIRQVASAIQAWRDHYLEQGTWTYVLGSGSMLRHLDLTREEHELGAILWDRMLEEGAGGSVFPLAQTAGVSPDAVAHAEAFSILTGDTFVLLREILDDEYRREIASIGLGPTTRFYNGRIPALDSHELRSRAGSTLWSDVKRGKCIFQQFANRLLRTSLVDAASRWPIVVIRDIARDAWCPQRVLGIVSHPVSPPLQQLVLNWYAD